MDDTTPKMVPIQNQNKIEQIVNSLKKMIIDGGLKPGTSLPAERELSAQLGVSRFSLREAFQVAKSQGLITVSRGKRVQVANPSPDAVAEIMSVALERSTTSYLDLIEARECLECQIARFAAQRADVSDIHMLVENLADLKRNQDHLSSCVEIDLRFHHLLVKASRNVVFEVMLAPLAQLLRESREQTMKADGVTRAIQGHEKILSSVKAHDAEAAAAAMSKHLKMAKSDLKRFERT